MGYESIKIPAFLIHVWVFTYHDLTLYYSERINACFDFLRIQKGILFLKRDGKFLVATIVHMLFENSDDISQ